MTRSKICTVLLPSVVLAKSAYLAMVGATTTTWAAAARRTSPPRAVRSGQRRRRQRLRVAAPARWRGTLAARRVIFRCLRVLFIAFAAEALGISRRRFISLRHSTVRWRSKLSSRCRTWTWVGLLRGDSLDVQGLRTLLRGRAWSSCPTWHVKPSSAPPQGRLRAVGPFSLFYAVKQAVPHHLDGGATPTYHRKSFPRRPTGSTPKGRGAS